MQITLTKKLKSTISFIDKCKTRRKAPNFMYLENDISMVILLFLYFYSIKSIWSADDNELNLANDLRFKENYYYLVRDKANSYLLEDHLPKYVYALDGHAAYSLISILKIISAINIFLHVAC